MADYATNLNLISPSQSQKEATANALFDAMSVGSYFGRDSQACAALTWGYYGGIISLSGTPTRIANGTLALTDNATCYIRQSTTTGVVDFVTSPPSGWPGPVTGYTALYEVTTLSGVAFPWLDFREGGGGGTGGGGGSVPTGTGFRHVTSGAEDGTAVAVDLSSADVTGTLAAARFLALTGDVTNSAGAVATTIANDAVTTVKILAANVTNAKLANMANASIKGRTTAGTGDPEDLTASQAAAILGTNVKSTESIIVACTDETTPITAATTKVTFRMPYAFTLTGIRASLSTAQTSGSIFTVDVNESGTTVISTKLTIDNTEKTTTTAATPAVISDSSLADDAEMTVDVDQIGDGTAKGLKITLIGNRT
jgi:hypothetical protein